jgi:hypothetical protein
MEWEGLIFYLHNPERSEGWDTSTVCTFVIPTRSEASAPTPLNVSDRRKRTRNTREGASAWTASPPQARVPEW